MTRKTKKKWSVWKGVGFMFKIIALIVIIVVLAPVGYFAWRAGQPMSLPEYDGRTYYELLAERRQAYDDLATDYQVQHPSVDVKTGMCFRVEMAVSLGTTLPWSALCTASELIPALRIYGPKTRQMGCGQMGATWTTFLSSWWQTYEQLLYTDILSTRLEGPVPYCRIPAP
jgi:hypothetical protein